ncbi:flagellar motor switch protein FliN/FliY [Sphingomonas sp. BE123]|jgi:flagellar motor switch protein FliN/FliY|uniref:FliM/FliN family flagellar motor switch protein n=1 Tax=unclassified Sphingomonas TaxID=196159 RepID=UPI00285BEE45|nr:FliM/FliN family flagellar motor switch protein [Sphingomonas sp. BE123]MDR6853472.1 flagellar motor switch protein FliN/FliY [Sphingomonas sp. BE123]
MTTVLGNAVLNDVMVELSIVLGSTQLPIRQVLKMSRGAIVALDSTDADPTLIYVNETLVARGRVIVSGEHMSIEISEVLPATGAA